MNNDKIERLKRVAQLYFLEDRTQQEIAEILNVSRPLISRMLGEAKKTGIVEIHIGNPKESNQLALNKFKTLFGIKGGIFVSDVGGNNVINQKLAESALSLLKELHSTNVGLGWGDLIGEIVTYSEQKDLINLNIEEIFPLIGNGGFSIRSYHSNENVRIIAQNIKAIPHYLHLPAFAETKNEKKLLCSTELYQGICQKWDTMDTALVNIGNYPSTPDFASSARFGDLFTEQKPRGRLLAYYFDEYGEIIKSDTDYTIQISIETLKKCKNIIGLCSANTSAQTLIAALKVNLFTHIIAREQLIESILPS